MTTEKAEKAEKRADPIADARRAASKCRARSAYMRLKAEELEQEAVRLEESYRDLLHRKGAVDAVG